nr:MAG TPA: hypothetical protein [Caudoviricetes sp.]DAU62725.1 MAG TPA: hypothetical protein [Caudoviricetes sp.]
MAVEALDTLLIIFSTVLPLALVNLTLSLVVVSKSVKAVPSPVELLILSTIFFKLLPPRAPEFFE